jgi:hypothetical protein
LFPPVAVPYASSVPSPPPVRTTPPDRPAVGDGDERPTVVPAFDPEAFAAEGRAQ